MNDTCRWYVAAYRAENGAVMPISTPNVIQECAERDAEAMRSADDQTEVFVAYRDEPKWRRLEVQP